VYPHLVAQWPLDLSTKAPAMKPSIQSARDARANQAQDYDRLTADTRAAVATWIAETLYPNKRSTRRNAGRVSYAPASLDGHAPDATANTHGFASYGAPVSGPKMRVRSETFGDHYGQARLFWNSMTPVEREHIVKALQFELSKVETRAVRVRMLDQLTTINDMLGAHVALALGETPATDQPSAPPGGSADSAAEIAVRANATSPTSASGGVQHTKGLSREADQPTTAKGRKVAILAATGTNAAHVTRYSGGAGS